MFESYSWTEKNLVRFADTRFWTQIPDVDIGRRHQM